MCDISEVRQKFIKRKGFFNQTYYSLRFRNFEITIDNQTPKDQYLVCLCSPYNERVDKLRHHRGMGGGEVKKDWTFNNRDDAFNFVAGMV